MAKIKSYIGDLQQKDCWADFETTKPLNNSGLSWRTIKRLKHENPDIDIEGVVYPQVYLWNVRFRPNDIFYWNKDGSLKVNNLITQDNLKDIWMGEDNKPDVKLEYSDIIKDKYDYIVFWGLNIDTFLDFVDNMKISFNMFFNNSKGFDAHFIMTKKIIERDYHPNSYLEELKEQLDYCETPEEKEELSELIKSTKTFSYIVNDNRKIYSLSFDNANKATIEIKDSILLFPLSIKKMGVMLAEHFIKKAPELTNYYNYRFHKMEQHGSKENNYNRVDLYNSFYGAVKDENEVKYFFQDTFILAEFHKQMYSVLPRKYWKLTIGATAYNDWLRRFGNTLFKSENYLVRKRGNGYLEYAPKKFYKSEKLKNKAFKPKNKIIDNLAKEYIDTQWLDEEDDKGYTFFERIYRYYQGGESWVNEEHQGKVRDHVWVADRKSSYPAEMNSDKDFPLGKPSLKKKEGYNYKLSKVIILKKMVNKDGLPFLSYVDEKLKKRIYPKVLNSGFTFYLTPEKLKHFKEYYKGPKGSYKVKTEFYFKTIKANFLFSAYIIYWFNIKEKAKKEDNPFLALFAKLMLNSLYGKMATKKIRKSKYWSKNNVWESDEEEIKSKFYLPWAAQITSGAQMWLVDVAGHNNKFVIGGDTDSEFMIADDIEDLLKKFPGLKLTNVSKNEIDNLGLGEIENKYWYYMIMRRSKQYYATCPKDTYYLSDNKKPMKKAFAGINFNNPVEPEFNELNEDILMVNELRLTDFIKGRIIEGQLVPFVIDGVGVVLEESFKQIPAVWDYKDIKNKEELIKYADEIDVEKYDFKIYHTTPIRPV